MASPYYAPPPPPPRPGVPVWVIAVLGACGGCVLLFAVLIVVGLSVAKESPAAHQVRAQLFQDQKNYVAAEKEWRLAYKRRKNDPQLLNNYAWCLYLNGKSVEAIPIAKRAVELSPDPNIIDTLAHAYLGAKQLNEAKIEFENALQQNPTLGASLDGMGQVYEAKKEDGKAYDFYLKAKKSGHEIEGLNARIQQMKVKLDKK